MNEIVSIRDYLARPQNKKDDKDDKAAKTTVNIPMMNKFERAILMST